MGDDPYIEAIWDEERRRICEEAHQAGERWVYNETSWDRVCRRIREETWQEAQVETARKLQEVQAEADRKTQDADKRTNEFRREVQEAKATIAAQEELIRELRRELAEAKHCR